MALPIRLLSGWGIRTPARVDELGHVFTTDRAAPAFGGKTTMRVFRQFMTNGGTASDSSDMRVDGSGTAVNFWIPAHSERDRYICRLNFTISDASASLNSFGTLTALATGCRLFYTDELGEVDIHEALKTNYNFVQLCSGSPAFAGSGATNSAFRAQNVSGTSEGYLPSLDLRATFGFEWGLRLKAGSKQRITLRVRDDTTGVDAFNVIAYGFERLPDDRQTL